MRSALQRAMGAATDGGEASAAGDEALAAGGDGRSGPSATACIGFVKIFRVELGVALEMKIYEFALTASCVHYFWNEQGEV